MQDLASINDRIAPLDQAACRRARDKWNGVAKPVGSLGVLEDAIVQIAGLTGNEDVRLEKRAVVVMCADNGVVAEGVSQAGSEVTLAVAENIARGESSVCSMARPHGIEAFAVDMGMCASSADPRVIDRAIARGTGNIAQGPAMTREQAIAAVQVGIDMVAELKGRGYDIIASGEMGIGNTTSSSALLAALLGLSADALVGKGAGLSEEGLARKRAAVQRAIAVNAPNAGDPIDVLAKVGGFDIAGIIGLFLGGALYRVPVVVDGFISMVAAYVATRIAPRSICAMLASHSSAEPAVRFIEEALVLAAGVGHAGLAEAGIGFRPIIQASMRLGEGTGAVCLIPLLDSALSLYNGSTFADIAIDAYDPDLVK